MYIIVYNTYFKIVLHTCHCYNNFKCLCVFLLFVFNSSHWLLWSSYEILFFCSFQYFSNKYACKLQQSATVTVQCSTVEKRMYFKQWILNWFLLVNLEMLIQTAIKLLDDLGVCQKTVGNLAMDFYAGGERKTQKVWIRMSERSLEQYNFPHLWISFFHH